MKPKLKLILITLSIFEILLFCSFSNANYAIIDQPCAILHSNILKFNLVLNHGDSHSDLRLVEPQKGNFWNITESLEVSRGCVLQVCNATEFLKGHCETYNQQQLITPSMGKILSASCKCPPTTVSCNDYFRFPKRTCALAFVNRGGCDDINRLYTQIDEDGMDSNNDFPQLWENSVSAFIVRPGCELTTYDDADFEGNPSEKMTNITKKIQLPVKSTECSCDRSVKRRSLQKPRQKKSWDDPESLEIPLDPVQLRNLSTNWVGETHPGILASMKSSQGNRSTRNAYILLLGTTGSGKSSTINFLFDNDNLTSTGGTTSVTDSIYEFHLPVPLPEFGISNSQLRIIDTPGLGDTSGLVKDASFLASLEHFLNNHEDLHDKIPNVLLIFYKFDSNRFHGPQTDFVKMLRALDSLRSRLTDPSNSNVIFVFTHFTSFKGSSSEVESHLRAYRQTIREYSRFPTPTILVVAENKPKGLPIENGYYQLPNREYYPLNLLNAISKVTQGCDDPIGTLVIRSAFRDPESLNNNPSHVSFPMIDPNHPDVLKYHQRLLLLNFNVNETQISRQLEESFKRLPSSLVTKFPSVLPELQTFFNMKYITNISQLPTEPERVVELLSQLRHNEAISFLLQDAFNLTSPLFPHDIVVGQGYDIFNDSYLSHSSPIIIGDFTHSEIGYKLPANLILTELSETTNIRETFENKAQYIGKLLKDWDIVGKIPPAQFNGSIRPGFNLKPEKNTHTLNFSLTHTLRTFELSLPSHFTLSPSFIQAVQKLPPLNQHNATSIFAWKQFFSDYGTHIVQSVYGGGFIEGRLNLPKNATPEEMEWGLKYLDDLQFRINRNRSERILSRFFFHGGNYVQEDDEGGSRDLSELRLVDAAERLRSWKLSVKFNPIILQDGMKLIPMSRIVRRELGTQVSSQIQNAVKLLFDSELVVKKPTTTRPPDRPRVLPNILVQDLGIFDKIGLFFKELWNAIKGWFS